jgi:transposase-like protein
VHLAACDGAGIIACVKHSSLAERADWAQRFHQSGLSQVEFARRHDLVLSTLRSWLRQYSVCPLPPRFAEVKLPALAARWAAEIVRADGTVLRLAHDAPAHLLQQLLPPC